MKPLIRCLLRMSLYQLLYMDSIPDSAVCNEACKLADKRKFKNLRGFVNAVLRTAARRKTELPLPDREKEPIAFLSVRYSMPEWIVRMWLREYGGEIAEKLLEELMRIHPVTIRFSNRLSEEERDGLLKRFSQSGFRWRESPYLPYVYTLENCAGVSSLPGFDRGAFLVQDVSSVLAVEAAGIRAEDFVMDVCAAPGGKSLLAAEKTAGTVLSRDVSEQKARLIEENRERMGTGNLTVQVHDATVFDETYRGKADVLLVDAPCSGLGVMGKKRDIKYHVTEKDLEELARLQERILRASWEYVKPGGILLYSTCTIDTKENEEMVRFITGELPFEPLPLDETLPEEIRKEKRLLEERRERAGSPLSVPLSEEERAACIQLLPGFMEADGFFMARFRRRAG